MKEAAKVLTVINCIFSSVLWLLGVLTLLFNILGLWEFWHLAGFGFIFFMPVSIIPMIFAIVISSIAKKLKFIITNLLFLAISIRFVLFTVFVSSTWFW